MKRRLALLLHNLAWRALKHLDADAAACVHYGLPANREPAEPGRRRTVPPPQRPYIAEPTTAAANAGWSPTVVTYTWPQDRH